VDSSQDSAGDIKAASSSLSSSAPLKYDNNWIPKGDRSCIISRNVSSVLAISGVLGLGIFRWILAVGLKVSNNTASRSCRSHRIPNKTATVMAADLQNRMDSKSLVRSPQTSLNPHIAPPAPKTSKTSFAANSWSSPMHSKSWLPSMARQRSLSFRMLLIATSMYPPVGLTE